MKAFWNLNPSLEHSCKGTFLQLGFRAKVTVTAPTAGALPLWQLFGVMPLPYWCLLTFQSMVGLKAANVFWLDEYN